MAAVNIALSDFVVGDEITTSQLAPPSGKVVDDFQSGFISESSNPLPDLDLGLDAYSEVEWVLSLGDIASEVLNSEIEFRVTDNGTPLDSYSEYPAMRCRVPFTGMQYEVFPLGTDNLQAHIAPITDSQIFSVLFAYGSSEMSIQAVITAIKSTLEGVVNGNIQSVRNALLVNDPISGEQTIKSGLFDYLLGFEAFINSISEGTFSNVQNIRNALLVNDPISGEQTIKSGLFDYLLGIGAFINSISEGSDSNVQNIRNALLVNDPISGKQTIKSGLFDHLVGIGAFINSISEGTFSNVQSIRNVLLVNDPISGKQTIKSGLFDYVLGFEAFINSISEGSDSNVQSIRNTLLVNDPISGKQTIKSGLFDYVVGIGSFINSMSEGLGNIQNIRNALLVNDPISGEQTIKSGLFDYISGIGSFINSMSEGLRNIQNVRNTLLVNDPISGEQTIKGGLFDYILGFEAFINSISEGSDSNVQSIRNKLLVNDPISGEQTIKSGLFDFISGIEAFINSMSDGLVNVQSVRNALLVNDPISGKQTIKSGLFDYILGFEAFINSVSEGTTGTSSVINSIYSAEIQAIQSLLAVIDEENLISGFQSLKNEIGSDTVSVINSTNFAIYLDGLNIQNLIGGDITLSFDQSYVHNEISFGSISETLFTLCDPSIREGEARIEVHLGSRILYFLLETRSGSGTSTTIWGRDATAVENTPWKESNNVSVDESVLVSEFAESISVSCPVTWDTYDWILPIGFETEGTTTEILSTFASEIGGVVRAQDDGSFLIRSKNKVRPVELPNATVEDTYLPSDIYDLSYSKNQGEFYNEVLVQMDTDVFTPAIEVEAKEDGSSYTQGETAFVRVFWAGTTPYVGETYATDGSVIQVIGTGVDGGFEEEIEEIIEFAEGVGEVDYPIASIINVEWIGAEGTLEPLVQHNTTLFLTDLTAFRIAKVTYKTNFGRYEVRGHNVETLMVVFALAVLEEDILVHTDPIAKDADGSLYDKRGSELTSSLLTEETGLILKGESWIDANKYNSHTYTFTTPYKDSASDGQIIWLDGIRVSSPGLHLVTKVLTTIKSDNVIYNTLEAIQWEV